jgi:hypothetical protein
MRKLLVSSFVSLDGVVESPMTWSSRFFDDECREYAYRKLGDVEFFLLGRKAYEAFVPAWPAITGNAYIDRINGLKTDPPSMKRFSTGGRIFLGAEEPVLQLDPGASNTPTGRQRAASPPSELVYQDSSVRGPQAGSAGEEGRPMDVMHERVAGLDVRHDRRLRTDHSRW